MTRPLPLPSSLLRREMELDKRAELLAAREAQIEALAARLAAYSHVRNLGGPWGAWLTPSCYADALLRAIDPERIDRRDLHRLAERLAGVWVAVLEREDAEAAAELAHRLAVEGWLPPPVGDEEGQP